jgi:uncharacterized protein (DUF1800 family)
MAITNQMRIQHLLWRAGFGPAAKDATSLELTDTKKLVAQMLTNNQQPLATLNVAKDFFPEMFRGMEEMGVMNKKELTPEDRRAMRQQNREGLKSLNTRWMEEMVNSQQQLREKMSLFWHGHFATRTINTLYQEQMINLIRQHALGNFGDLLKAVSKSASMLVFLNNNQNRKKQPNENFAREVMELFTLGRGNYTENDIKEAARAFTGWTNEVNGEFRFRPLLHDDGSKTIFGQTGNFGGEEVLDLLLKRKETAIYITRKIYRYFVNDQVDEANVVQLADQFYKSNYNIALLMQSIFTANWFYSEKNVGAKIKSPVELWVGIRRMLPMRLENEASQLLIQRLLGQILFYPPNVAGWPGGKTWIDSSTLFLRLRLPQIIKDNDVIALSPKSDDDVMMGMKEKMQAIKKAKAAGGGMQIMADVQWEQVNGFFSSVPRPQLLKKISDAILQTDTSKINLKTIEGFVDAGSREKFIQTAVINLMSTPEYQLC